MPTVDLNKKYSTLSQLQNNETIVQVLQGRDLHMTHEEPVVCLHGPIGLDEHPLSCPVLNLTDPHGSGAFVGAVWVRIGPVLGAHSLLCLFSIPHNILFC